MFAHAVTALKTPPAVMPWQLVSSARQMSLTTDFSADFEKHQRIDALVQRGKLEASLMQARQGLLEEPAEISLKTKKKSRRHKGPGPSTATAARTLKEDGVVRLNNALSASTAAMLRTEILERRAQGLTAMNNGEDWTQYFANVFVSSNRWDLLLPLKGMRGVQAALRELFVGSATVCNVFLSLLGDDATLYDLAVFISEPGSPRQPVHPDNPHQEHPLMLTCFVALQDIHSFMGPTTFIPKTHTAAAHAEYDDIFQCDAMLSERPSVVALLNSGDAVLYDSRTMHCGGLNDVHEGATRALLYFSFLNPLAILPEGEVGSILSDIKPITLREICTKLADVRDNDISFDPFDEVKAETVREESLVAKEDSTGAQC